MAKTTQDPEPEAVPEVEAAPVGPTVVRVFGGAAPGASTTPPVDTGIFHPDGGFANVVNPNAVG